VAGLAECATIEFEIIIYTDEANPCFAIPSELVARIARLRANLGVDIYALPNGTR
jgi:hypothetical protein